MGVPSDRDGGPKKIKPFGGLRHNNPSLRDILAFVDGLSLTDTEKDRLRAAARKVPHGALASFRKNYMRYIRKESRP